MIAVMLVLVILILIIVLVILNIKIYNLYDKIINIIDIDVHNKYFKINFIYNGHSYYTISTNKIFYKTIINKILPTTIKI